MERRNIFLILFVIIILLIIIGFAIYRLNLAWRESQTQVLMSRHSLSRGTEVQARDLYWKTMKKSDILPIYFTRDQYNIGNLAGSVVLRPIMANEPISRNNIIQISDESKPPYSELITPGMRAISLPIDTSSASVFLVQPGDRVDLVLTYSTEQQTHHGRTSTNQGPANYVTKTLIPNVLVLGVYPKKRKEGFVLIPETGANQWASIEVTPKQVELIKTALRIGRVSISLKSQFPGIDLLRLPSQVTTEDITGTIKKKKRKPNIVTIIRGAKTENVNLDNGNSNNTSRRGMHH